MNKTVLLLCYYYLPCNHSASKRSGCLAKYLPTFGWKALVLSNKWTENNCTYDLGFIKNLPADAVVGRADDAEYSSRYPGKFFRKINTFLLPHHFPFHYRRNAKKQLSRIVEENKIDIIWATSPPDAPLWLASWCKKKWGIPWVADFRDVWGTCPFMINKIMDPIHVFHEKRMMRTASAIVTVSDHLVEVLQKRHKRTVHLIPNGFDPEGVVKTQPVSLPNFRIVFTGSVGRKMIEYGVLLAEVINHLHLQGSINKDNISIEFYSDNTDLLKEFLQKPQFISFIKISKRVSAEECIDLQRNAAVLLMFTYNGFKGMMTGKIFEYLSAKRPILVIPNDHDCVEQVVKETNAGSCCSTSEEIEKQILFWFTEWKKTEIIAYHGNEEAIMKYSRKEQANKFAKIFNEISKAN